MSPAAIADYLSQVAPLPFDPEFTFGAEIAEALGGMVDMGHLDIRIDGSETPLYRPHRLQFDLDGKQVLSFHSLDIIRVAGIDGDSAAVGWILHHDYEGAVPTGTLVKGLRLRAGNIQVGDSALLEDLFPEPRFNGWSVGEVHVIDCRIVPNGRRDHFEQNTHFHNLTNHLAPTARDIARRCRTSSVRRRWFREFELKAEYVMGTIGIIVQGSVSRPERERLALTAEQGLMQMGKIAGMAIIAETRGERDVRIGRLRTKLAAAMNDQDDVKSPLMRLPEPERRMYEHLFELVYESSTNRAAARALIDRILVRLNQGYSLGAAQGEASD